MPASTLFFFITCRKSSSTYLNRRETPFSDPFLFLFFPILQEERMIPKQSLVLLGILLLTTVGEMEKGAFEQILDVNLGKGDLCCVWILEIIIIIKIKKMKMNWLGHFSWKSLFCFSFILFLLVFAIRSFFFRFFFCFWKREERRNFSTIFINYILWLLYPLQTSQRVHTQIQVSLKEILS